MSKISTPAWRRVLRWARRIALGSLAVAAFSIIALAMFLETDPGREIARAQIESRMREKFPGGVTIGAFEGSVFGRITLRDVAIYGPDGRPAVLVKTLQLGIDLLPLLSRRVRLTEVGVEDVNLWVARDASGKIEIAHLIPELDWSIEIPDLRVYGAHVALDNAGQRIDLDAMDLTASLRIPQNAPFEGSVELRGHLRQRDLPFAITAGLRSSVHAVEVPYLRGRLGDALVVAHGLRATLKSPTTEPTYTGLLSMTAPRAVVARLVPELARPVDLTASMVVSHHGTTTRLMLDGKVDDQSMTGSIDVEVAAYRAHGWLAAKQIDAGALTAGRVRGTGSVYAAFDVATTESLDWPTGTLRVYGGGNFEDVPDTNLAITLTSQLAGVIATDVRVVSPHGVANATGELRVTGDGIRLERGTMKARADLAAVPMPIRGTLDVDLTATGTILPNLDLAVRGNVGGQRLRASGIEIDSMKLAFEASNLPQQPRGRGELTARGVGRDKIRLREVAVTASNHADGSIKIAVRAQPQENNLRVDANALIDPQRRRVSGAVDIAGVGLGAIRMEADVETPKELTDVAAWRNLRRSAIRTARVKLDGVELAGVARLAGLAGTHAGRIDGDLRLSRAGIAGQVSIRDAIAPALQGRGALTATVRVSQASDELISTMSARFGNIAIEGDATVALPDRLLDPATGRLGRDAIKRASVRIAELELEPGLLDRFGVTTNVRGRVTATAEIARGVRSANLAVTVRELRGSPIVQPIDVDMTATIDATALQTRVQVRSAQGPLLGATGRIGFTIDQLVANPGAVLAASLEGTATLAAVPAPQLLAVFGRSDLTRGTLAGELTVAGTVGVPTFRAHFTGTDIAGGSRQTVAPGELTVDATWNGTSGKVVIDGKQKAGSLKIVASGSPLRLGDATVTIDAKTFDLLPLLVFAPGPIGASRGQLDAKLSIKGLDPRTATLAGELHVTHARIPIAPVVGTLQPATIDLVVRDREIKLAVDGRLGRGTVKARGTIGLDGVSPRGGITVELRKVSPIGVLEPEFSADITTKLRRDGSTWLADVAVENGYVDVPTRAGEGLKPVGAPADMTFGTVTKPRRPILSRPPSRPLLIANVVVHPMRVVSTDVRSVVSGKLVVTADETSVGIVGAIDAERGDLELFGRRYHVERATVRFDGSPDPLIDVRITHDFPDVTTVTLVHGRLSKPELTMSSNPGIYSQGQLLGFLLGGEPRGDPATGSLKDSASGAGSSLVGAQISTYVRKALPIDLDVLRYETATSTSSGAITVGTWLTRRLFLGYRSRPSARLDENFAEGQVEYWLTRRLVIEGAGGDRGYSGVDLLWRKRY